MRTFKHTMIANYTYSMISLKISGDICSLIYFLWLKEASKTENIQLNWFKNSFSNYFKVKNMIK